MDGFFKELNAAFIANLPTAAGIPLIRQGFGERHHANHRPAYQTI